MSFELGLILSFGIAGIGGAGLAAFAIWLRKRDCDSNRRERDSLKHA